jgi:hypothetical protein
MTQQNVPQENVPGPNQVPGTVMPAQGSDLPAQGSGGPAQGSGGPLAANDPVADAVAQLTDADLTAAQRRAAIGRLAVSLRERGFRDLFRPKAAMTWIADTVVEVAPRIPLRDVATLRRHNPGLTDMQIATRLARTAARTTAGIGALGGGVAAVEWAAPPALLTAPALLAAETIAVVAVEIKLIGELQELYGQPVPGSHSQRALSLLQAWAGRRGVNLLVPGRTVAAVLGTAARHELRDRLLGRFGRNLTTLGPLLTGAAVAAYLNRRATMRLSREVRTDLFKRVPKAITPG